MPDIISQIAVISQTSSVSVNDVTQISAALQKQVERDLSPIWGVRATVSAFTDIGDMPHGYWPILIRSGLPREGLAGFHLRDEDKQPYALVEAGATIMATALSCSHECLEMLTDAYGNRLMVSDSLMNGQGRVKYLLEICDPVQTSSYLVNGLQVADFYTPQYFDPVANPSVGYSYSGKLTGPRTVLPGGYLSWLVPETGEWWQATFYGSKLKFQGPFTQELIAGQSWRECIDQRKSRRLSATKSISQRAAKSKQGSPPLRASGTWAERFQADVEKTIASAKR